MRAFALATTAVAVLALAVPVRAQTTDPVVAIVNGTQLKKSDLEAAYASLPDQYRQMPLDAIYDPLLDQLVSSSCCWPAPTRRSSTTTRRSRRRSPGHMTACCATR